MKTYKLLSLALSIALLVSCAPVTPVSPAAPTQVTRPQAVATQPAPAVPWPGLHDGWMKFFSNTYFDKVAYDPAGSLFASTNDGHVIQWNVETQRPSDITPADGVPGTIFAMTVRNDVLWISLFNGQIGRYFNGNWVFQQLASTLYYFSDTGADLWLSSNRHLFRLVGQEWQVFDVPSEITGLPVNRVVETPDGTLWFWANNIISLTKDGQWHTYENLRGVVDIIGEPGGRIWFIFSTLAVSLENGNWSSLALPNNTFVYFVNRSQLSPDGNLWLSTDKGDYIVEGRTVKEVSAVSAPVPELADTSPLLFVGAETIYLYDNILYVCGQDDCKEYQLPRFHALDKIVTNQVIGFTPDGALWTRNSKEGFVRFDGVDAIHPFQFDRFSDATGKVDRENSVWMFWPGRKELIRFVPGLHIDTSIEALDENSGYKEYGLDTNRAIVDFAFSTNNEMWLAFSNGMIASFFPDDYMSKELPYGYQKVSLNFIPIGGDDYGFVHPSRIEVDGKGNVWVVAENGSIYKYNGTEWTNYEVHQLVEDVTAFAVSPEGNVWFGTSGSLYKLDGKRWVEYKKEKIEPAFMVVGLDETVWFADKTMNSVYRFDGESWKQFATPDGLPWVVFSKIVVAPDGAIWLFSPYNIWARYKP
jgi:streptogramin lyase